MMVQEKPGNQVSLTLLRPTGRIASVQVFSGAPSLEAIHHAAKQAIHTFTVNIWWTKPAGLTKAESKPSVDLQNASAANEIPTPHSAHVIRLWQNAFRSSTTL
eukprot:m.330625 g.330625  ORF g.330625 m.330625 type:complete len:103 (-) comp55612_c0_seq5:798-1106(-)